MSSRGVRSEKVGQSLNTRPCRMCLPLRWKVPGRWSEVLVGAGATAVQKTQAQKVRKHTVVGRRIRQEHKAGRGGAKEIIEEKMAVARSTGFVSWRSGCAVADGSWGKQGRRMEILDYSTNRGKDMEVRSRDGRLVFVRAEM